MNTYMNRKGMVGVIVAVVILSLLMTTSMSYIKIVQTESQIATSIDYSDRAMDAAFCGIQYAMAVAQTQDELFIDSSTQAKNRLYLVEDKTDIDTQWGSISDKSESNHDNLINTDWVCLDANLMFLDNDNNSVKPYIYRAIIYPKNDAGSIDTGIYFIKSQGIYQILDEIGTVEAKYKFQIFAEIKIDLVRRKQRLNRWRRQDYQDDTVFFAYEPYL